MTRAAAHSRLRISRRLVAPGLAALGLHATALGLAATVGFRIASVRTESAGVLALEVKERVELPAPLPLPGPVGRDVPAPLLLDPIEAPPEPAPAFLTALPEPLAPEPDAVLAAQFLVLEPLPAESLVARAGPRSAPGRLGVGGGAPAGGGGTESGAPSASALALLAPIGAPRGGKPGAGAGEGGAPRIVAVEPARVLATQAPAYPRLSTRSGEEGAVTCRMHVSPEGRVTKVEVVHSSGFERLDDAAREALAQWRFSPRKLDGRAVASTFEHTVRFVLETRASS